MPKLGSRGMASWITLVTGSVIEGYPIWSEWRLTVIAATVRIALVDILDLSEVDIPAGVFLHPAVGQWAGAEDGEGIRPAAGTGNE